MDLLYSFVLGFCIIAVAVCWILEKAFVCIDKEIEAQEAKEKNKEKVNK